VSRVSRTSRPRLLAGLSALLTVVALTSACGPEPKKAGGGGGKSASASGSTTVHVKNFSFDPQNLTVSKGTKVTWTFEDSTDHNVAASDKSFKSKDLKSGGTYSFTFNTAGKYAYICTIHQYMSGSVTVQ
jgi:plastocyanin